ncbi:MAG: hypothetical protein NTU41_15050 [Chloroflexi bacterium]|nr:hypothetical protein [Chloroflexota bacterium]
MKKWILLLLAVVLLLSPLSSGCAEKEKHSLTIAVAGQGTTVPGRGTSAYNEGSEVGISATPDPGWKFDHWGGDISGAEATVTVRLDGNRSIIAVFSPVAPSYSTPAEYEPLYAGLQGKLDDFEAYLNSHWDGIRHDVTFGAELLSANSNMGEKLLTEENYTGVLAYLDALQFMGIQGLKIAIGYPLLTPDFPNYPAYVGFYRKLAQECRARELTILVAMGNLFLNTPFSDLNYSLSGLTLAGYREGKRRMAETIIREMHPDYLSLANEPTTEYMLTGIRQTPSDFAGTVRYILNGLDRSGVLIGAGAGTWNDMAYIQELAENTDLDYIDMHIYPSDYLEQAVTAADIARAYHKRLVIGEAWLYKVKESEMADLGKMATQATVFGRDVYSFWQPLDARFLEVLVKLAAYQGYEFISPFWSTFLFGYADYASLPRDASYAELRQRANGAAYLNMLTGQLSAAGLTYQALTRANTSTG